MSDPAVIVQRPQQVIEVVDGAPQVILERPVQVIEVTHRGPPGASSGAGTVSPYVHAQPQAAAQWIINHNLGRKPAAVTLLTVGGVQMIADVTHVSDNQVIASFAAPIAGSALVI